MPLEVTPERAGWRDLTFRVHALASGSSIAGRTAGEEAVVVLLGGGLRMEVGDQTREVTGRRTVFDGLPYYAYVPRNTTWRFTALSDGTELAWGQAPSDSDRPARIMGPKDCKVEMRGGHNVSRQITHLLDPDGGAQRLLCVEVYTPSGNWSSYPPHKHDVHNPPHEVKLEEVYYYRIQPEDGFAIQRLYGGSHEELVLARHGDAVLVRDGYHPVVAGPGYDVYYLNVLAGDEPSWAAADDPELAWVRGVWNSRQPLKLPMQP